MAKSNTEIFEAVTRAGTETRQDLKTVHVRLDDIQKDNSVFREAQAGVNATMQAHVENTAIHVNPSSKTRGNGWTPQKIGAAIAGGLTFFGAAVYGIIELIKNLVSG